MPETQVSREFGGASQTGPAQDSFSIAATVRTYIIENFLLGNANGFADDTELMESGILDSTGAMELVAFLEKTFNIPINEDEILPENLNSVNQICAFVGHKAI